MADLDFERFVADVEPRLRKALAGHLPVDDVPDAVGEALAYAWSHRGRVLAMENPAGYLYRVGQSKVRQRQQGWLPWSTDHQAPLVEPGLLDAFGALPAGQARAVWLVEGCGWTHREAGEALGVSPSTISTHVARGMRRLRTELGVEAHG